MILSSFILSARDFAIATEGTESLLGELRRHPRPVASAGNVHGRVRVSIRTEAMSGGKRRESTYITLKGERCHHVRTHNMATNVQQPLTDARNIYAVATRLAGFTNGIDALAFSVDGRLLAIGGARDKRSSLNGC